MNTKALTKIKEISREVIQNTVKTLPDKEKQLLLVWSQNALQIHENKELSKSQKLTALRQLDTPEVLK